MSYQSEIYVPDPKTAGSTMVRPKRAIVISEVDHDHSRDLGGNRLPAILTTHDISTDGGQHFTIGPGRVVTHQVVRELVQEIGVRQPLMWLDDRMLACGSEGFVWHSPSRIAPMFWMIGNKQVHFRARWPHLLFSVTVQHGLRTFAVAPCDRPKRNAKLYLPPLGNIYENHTLCYGSVAVPEPLMQNRDAFEDAIYRSNFSHANAQVLTKKANAGNDGGGRQDLFAYWRNLSRGNPKPCPVTHMQASSLSLRDLL